MLVCLPAQGIHDVAFETLLADQTHQTNESQKTLEVMAPSLNHLCKSIFTAHLLQPAQSAGDCPASQGSPVLNYPHP